MPDLWGRIAFGPIPSRRLGRSLGVNNIPPKVCTYACTYCQLGHTSKMQIERSTFYRPEEIAQAVEAKVAQAHKAGERVDYLSFVPDGEPTLDINLGREIDLLRPLGIPIAVISNAALIWQPDVRADLAKADWVSLKVDAAREPAWRQVDRPHGSLRLDDILHGLLDFAQAYSGKLVSETMLVAGLNDGEDQVREVAEFLGRLRPGKAYLSVPTRPPAETYAHAPDEDTVAQAYRLLNEKVEQVECLTGYEGNAFAVTGNVEEDLLSIAAVHPMREKAVSELLARAGADWTVVQRLLDHGELVMSDFQGHRFYVRKLQNRQSMSSRDSPSLEDQSPARQPLTDKVAMVAYHAIGRVENAFTQPTMSKEIETDESRIVLDPALIEGLEGLEPGQKLLVIFHLHRSQGYELRQHPRGDPGQPKRGVFALRSPRRPNPIGVTEVELVAIEGNVLRVRGLDALDGSPVLDIKPA